MRISDWSSDVCSSDLDYFGDTRRLSAAKRAERGMGEGEDWDETIFNVFCKDGDAIRHHWASEMAYAPEDPGQHHRAGDLVDPLWGLLDMTPERSEEQTSELQSLMRISYAVFCSK